jgi:tRNA(Ile)-lysidine synthase
MNNTILERVREYLATQKMIQSGDTVCVACSGGADSVLLLLLLAELSAKSGADRSPLARSDQPHDEIGLSDASRAGCEGTAEQSATDRKQNGSANPAVGKRRTVLPPFRVRVCHVNHKLRGDESDGDERFVRELAERLALPIDVFRVDVADRAKREGIGLEEAGRLERRKAFQICLAERGATKIALAHHENDQAETVLYHLARGSALTGLGGIRPCGEKLIRPLLFLSREEIIGELKRRGESWRTDSSNETDLFARNRIRHGVLPLLEKEINKEATRHIAQAAESLRLAQDFLSGEAERRAPEHCKQEEGAVHLSDSLLREPEILRMEIGMRALESIAGGRKDLERIHVKALLALFGRESGKRIALPYSLVAVRGYHEVLLKRDASDALLSPLPGSLFRTDVLSSAEPVRITGSGTYRFGSVTVEVRLLSEREAEEIRRSVPEKTYTKYLNYGKMKHSLAIRNRNEGDYLLLDEEGRRQKLKSRLINDKVAADCRDRVILIADGAHVWWAVGGRISADVRITEQTGQIVRITVQNEGGNGGAGKR